MSSFARGHRRRASLKRRMHRLYPERQVLVRSRGRVRFLALSPATQIAISLLLLLVAGGVAHGIVNYVVHERALAAKDAQIREADEAYRSLLGELTAYERRLVALTRYVEGSHAKLLGLVEQNSALKTDLDSTETLFKATEAERARVSDVRDALQRQMRELEDALVQVHRRTSLLEGRLDQLTTRYANVEAEREQLVSVRDGLRQQIEELEGQLQALTDNNAVLSEGTARLKERLAASEAERLHLVAVRDDLEGEVDALEKEVHGAATRTVILEEELDSLGLKLNRAVAERNDTAVQRDRLDARARELEEELAAHQSSERALLLRLTESTVSQMGELKRIVATTGLSVEELLPSAMDVPGGQGGPFLADPSTSFVEEDSFAATVASLDLLIDQWEDLQELLHRLPLAAPSDSYYVSSRFGKRRDPITKKPAIHYGVDLAGVRKSPVLSTAPGVVTSVGWHHRFGKLIEVDHGMGIRTRYAHLSKILVKKGQRVGHREKVGLLGNTGRSTGPHIHYEILVKGVPVDPLKFIEAGKHVFKG